MPDHDTLTALLRDWAVVRGDQEAVVFATNPIDAAGDQCLTYAELDRTARRVAALLHLHADPGDRVLLLNEPGLGFVAAFFGCVYAGMIAVPTPPPGGHRSHQARLAGIARDAGVKVALSEQAGLDAVQEWAHDAGLDTMACLAVDGALPPAEQWADPGTTNAESLVFLQYTSGSTGDPKGVMVDHGNVRANTEVFCQVTGATSTTRFGGWLPTFHDFGLIGLLLTPLCLGTTTVLMSPLAFVKRPYAWLRLLDRHRVNLTAAPNFAFDLCVRAVTEAQAAGIDLSPVTRVLNGSEPIHAATQQAFIERFRPHGLDPAAMLPSYGLAEATLAVSCTDRRRGMVVTGVDAYQLGLGLFAPARPEAGTEEHTRLVVSCGAARDGVVVVDPVKCEILPDGRIGEIWVRGPHVTRGYWNRPDATRAVFGATSDRGGGYMRTGDLGTIHDGQLYVTGRIKEVLIVRGQNLYPQDLEATVRAAHPALARGVGAAFTVPTPDEEIVIVQECRAHALEDMTPSGLAAEIRSAIRRDFGVAVGGVVLVRPSQVRRTTSGKIQRGLTRELFTKDELTALHEDLTPAMRARYRDSPA
ncbi:fatty acyl-AMP ligase [Nonomuraea diastatica]|uniref:Fatty acyl-AMP ligase n=1 Tax=Nonomuraea diastatica TaxID=1848329 RepID=A0A4V2YER2_9ACTN|nr:fatty acyl-AMP ligase [Nonomuraea diastatica]TDD20266.1 fatty acyl-AMP ligase [Nonomuraea diastatica]